MQPVNIKLSHLYTIQTYQKIFPSDSLRAVIALESLLPDDRRVPEPHTSYTDTGGKTVSQDNI